MNLNLKKKKTLIKKKKKKKKKKHRFHPQDAICDSMGCSTSKHLNLNGRSHAPNKAFCKDSDFCSKLEKKFHSTPKIPAETVSRRWQIENVTNHRILNKWWCFFRMEVIPPNLQNWAKDVKIPITAWFEKNFFFWHRLWVCLPQDPMQEPAIRFKTVSLHSSAWQRTWKHLKEWAPLSSASPFQKFPEILEYHGKKCWLSQMGEQPSWKAAE